MANQAFAPQSNTFARAVTIASQACTPAISPVPPSAAQLVLMDYRIVVVGTQPVFLAFAGAGATAPTAAIPIDGANASGIMIQGAASYTLQLPYGTQIAAIAPAIGSTIYVCIGTGIAM